MALDPLAERRELYQLNWKFELLRDLMSGRWADGRHYALLESIRNEVLDVSEAT